MQRGGDSTVSECTRNEATRHEARWFEFSQLRVYFPTISNLLSYSRTIQYHTVPYSSATGVLYFILFIFYFSFLRYTVLPYFGIFDFVFSPVFTRRLDYLNLVALGH